MTPRSSGRLDAKTMRPVVPPGFVLRPRLDTLLDSHTAGSATLVCAGPGYGKTLAVASWASRRGSTSAEFVAWLALDHDDNDPALFWSGVVRALRSSGAVPSDNPMADLVPGPAVGGETARRIRQGIGALARPVVLVLDDVHVIDRPDILDALSSLLRYPGPLRLVLLARRDPLLPLHRLRLNGDLQEIRAADLAFTAAESADLLRQNNVKISADEVDRLVHHTEGWVAGLRLAAMFLSRKGAAHSVDEFTGDQRAVADYLVSEVLDPQPPDMRRFLLSTSVVPDISTELASALVGGNDSRHRLDQLERANMFVTLVGPHPRSYRYHPLMREMLVHQFWTTDPAMFRSVHRRAAFWYASHDAPLEALRHAAAAEDWPLLGRLFVSAGAARLLTVERRTLEAVLATVPDSEVSTPELYLCAAARLLLTGRFSEMRPLVAAARRLQAGSVGTPATPTAVITAMLELTVARVTGDMPGVIAKADEAIDLLDRADGAVPAPYRGVALVNRGVGLLWTGELAEARACLQTAHTMVEASGIELAQLTAVGHLGVVAAVTGRLDEAHAQGEQGVALVEQRGWSNLVQAASSFLALALVHLDRGDPAEADRHLHRGLAAFQVEADPAPAAALQIIEARSLLLRGQPAAALALLAALVDDLTAAPTPGLVRRWLALATAEAHLAAGEPAQAQAALPPTNGEPIRPPEAVTLAQCRVALGDLAGAARLLEPVRERSLPDSATIAAWVLTAVIAEHRREDSRALDAISRALELAAPERIRRPFVMIDRSRTALLLNRHLRLNRAESAFAQTVRATIAPPHARVPQQRVTEPLTERELTVLQFLPSMLTNAEIADEIFVSVNTIKAHLKGLYRKLDVANRREAVARGRNLGMIP